MSRTSLVLAGLAGFVLVLGPAACKNKEKAPWKLPVDAKQIPSTATVIQAELIEGMRETDPRLKQAYTAGELGAEVCREGTPDPAHQLELMSIFGPLRAKAFFSKENLAKTQSLLECGGVLAESLDGNFQTAVGFIDDAGKKAEIDILHLKVEDLPPKYGLTKRAFGAHEGYCRTSDPTRPNVTLDCTADSDAALKEGSTWFLGKRGELDAVARTLAKPKPDLSTQVAALNDAANQVEGLSSLRIESQLTTSKPFITAPCSWGAFESGGSENDFIQGCFPASDDKIIQEIDSKLRAAAFEIEADVLKAGAVHGAIVLVSRDDAAGKIVEKDALDLAADWKAQIENNEAKLVKQAKTNPVSLRQKSWAIIVDNFSHALQKIKVTRSGRTVKMSFNDPLPDEDRRDLEDAKKQTLDRRAAVADVLGAIQSKQAVPVAALAKLVGPAWAAYLVQLSTFNPAALPVECSLPSRPTPPVGKGKKALATAIPAVDPRCLPPVEPPAGLFGEKPR